jgi:hypothetical protein
VGGVSGASFQLAALLEMMHAPTQDILALYERVLLLAPGRAQVYHNMGRLLQEPGKDLAAAQASSLRQNPPMLSL